MTPETQFYHTFVSVFLKNKNKQSREMEKNIYTSVFNVR